MDGRMKKYLPLENLEGRQDCVICSLQKRIGRFLEGCGLSLLARSKAGPTHPVKPRRRDGE
jgi:hypothetical protein